MDPLLPMLALFHVAFTFVMVVALYNLAEYRLYRRGWFRPNSVWADYYQCQELLERARFIIPKNSGLLLLGLFWHFFGLSWIGGEVPPFRIGWVPDILSWPHPLILLATGLLVLTAGTVVMLKGRQRRGLRISIWGASLLVPLFFYAIPFA